MVIFELSSLKTSSSGRGKISSTLFSSPTGSPPGAISLYITFFFINLSAFAPITSANYSKHRTSICKANSHNSIVNVTETKIPFFNLAMILIYIKYSFWIIKSILGFCKRNTMLQLIFDVLFRIPLKAFLAHAIRLAQSHINSNIKVCINSHIL